MVDNHLVKDIHQHSRSRFPTTVSGDVALKAKPMRSADWDPADIVNLWVEKTGNWNTYRRAATLYSFVLRISWGFSGRAGLGGCRAGLALGCCTGCTGRSLDWELEGIFGIMQLGDWWIECGGGGWVYWYVQEKPGRGGVDLVPQAAIMYTWAWYQACPDTILSSSAEDIVSQELPLELVTDEDMQSSTDNGHFLCSYAPD